jgi:SAM-dependent methyltransferase
MPDRKQLRATFEEVAELYDQVRPTYPPALIDDLLLLGRLGPDDRVLEIGPGTGQATAALAERGLELVCVELGERLAAVARTQLAAYPNVTVLNEDFERWAPAEAGFDAVVAFTSFHWLDPADRLERVAGTLRGEGTLAVVETQHVLPEGGDAFWAEVKEDYDAVMPNPANHAPPPPEAHRSALADEIWTSGLFRSVAVRGYLWEATYTAEEYVAVLETYSSHRALPAARRDDLHGRIRRRIAARPDPRVTKTYLFTLAVARKLPARP